MADMGLGERVVVGGVVGALCGLIVGALLWFPRVDTIGTKLERFDRSDYDDGDVSGGLPVPLSGDDRGTDEFPGPEGSDMVTTPP